MPGRVEVYRVQEKDPDTGELVPTVPERWSWRLVVKGRIVAGDMHQGYSRRADCVAMAEKVTGGDYADARLVVQG